jgi:hypothetical protein
LMAISDEPQSVLGIFCQKKRKLPTGKKEEPRLILRESQDLSTTT